MKMDPWLPLILGVPKSEVFWVLPQPELGGFAQSPLPGAIGLTVSSFYGVETAS